MKCRDFKILKKLYFPTYSLLKNIQQIFIKNFILYKKNQMRKIKFSIVLFLLSLSLFFVSWCFEKPKNWPAVEWDRVFLDFVATFENYKDVLYDTSEKSTADSFLNKYENIKFEKMMFVLWEDDKIPQKIQDSIIWMKPWETKTIVLTPSDMWFSSKYDPTKITTNQDKISKMINNPIYNGSIRKSKDNKIQIITKVEDLWDRYQITVDENDMETYQNIVYTITLLQVWWKELIEEKL